MANLDFNKFGCIRMPEVSESKPRQKFTWNPPENLPVNPPVNHPTVTQTSNAPRVPRPLPGNELHPQPSAFSHFWWPVMKGCLQILAVLGIAGMIFVLIYTVLKIIIPYLLVAAVILCVCALASNKRR